MKVVGRDQKTPTAHLATFHASPPLVRYIVCAKDHGPHATTSPIQRINPPPMNCGRKSTNEPTSSRRALVQVQEAGTR